MDTIKSIEFPNINEAIENGIMKVTIDDQPTQEMAYQTEYVKENGKWALKSISEIQLQKPSTHFDQLKDLAWLVGEWEDSDENITILFENEWDKYKNFDHSYTFSSIEREVDGEILPDMNPVTVEKIK